MITSEWRRVIDSWAASLAAGGSPATTITQRRQCLEHFARRADCEPTEVTEAGLIAYMSAQRWARETRRSRRGALRLFFRWAESAGIVEASPAENLPKVRAAEPRPRPCPDAAYKRALLASDRRTRLMLRLGAELGLRRAEVARIHARDLLDDLGGLSLIVHGKGERERVVPLPAGLAAELSEACAGGYAFPSRRGGHISPRWCGKLVGELLPEGLTMHTLRHRFASRAWASGVDVFVLQSILGHASPATTRRYVEVPRARAREAIEGLAA